MEQENKTIHDFDLALIAQYFAALERQGPGSKESTLKALSFIENLTPHSRIADIGCGTGTQTIHMAQNIPGIITGIDCMPEFIDIFNHTSQMLALQNRLHGVVGTMENLPFKPQELDLIWAEGAIYNIGFEDGINLWRPLLKSGGYIAVTEISWLTAERPAPINDFWAESYPEIDTIPNKSAQMQKAGYIPIATFVLPENCWTDNFYTPQIAAQEAFLANHKDSAAAQEFVLSQRHEAELYHKYKAYYSYVFYIGKKI